MLEAALEEKRGRTLGTPPHYMKEYEKQKQFTLTDKRIRLLLGGNRSGKTIWGAHECSRFMHKEHPVIEFDAQPMGIWVCTESYDVHRDVLQPMLKKYLEPKRILDQAFIKAGCWSWIKYLAVDGTITEVSFKSYDAGRDKFQGAGKQLIWFDEECPYDIWEECVVRVEAGRKLRIILTMTPVNGMTWVYDHLYLNTANDDIGVMTVTWDDNVFLSLEEKAEMARGLTDQALQVRREGKFIRMTGLVCPWFARDVHVKPLQFNPGWTLYRAIDFGFSNPTCCIWIGVDYDDNWYVYDGIYQTQLTTPQLRDAINRKDAKRYITNCWADSAQQSDIQELVDAGIGVIGVEKESGSKESWDEYRARILNEHGRIQGNGKPKIYISSNLTVHDEKLGREVNWAVSEIEKLRWADKITDGVQDFKPRWGPQPNHFIDALSYFAHEYRKEHKFSDPKPAPADDRPLGTVPLYGEPTTGYDPYDA